MPEPNAITFDELPGEKYPANIPKEQLRQMVIQKHPELADKLAPPAQATTPGTTPTTPTPPSGGVFSGIQQMAKQGGALSGPSLQQSQQFFKDYEHIGKPAFEAAGGIGGAALTKNPVGLMLGPAVGRAAYRGLEGSPIIPTTREEIQSELENMAWDATLGYLVPKVGKVATQTKTYDEVMNWLVGNTSKYPESQIMKGIRAVIPPQDVDELYNNAKRFAGKKDPINVQPIVDDIKGQIQKFKLKGSQPTVDFLEDVQSVLETGNYGPIKTGPQVLPFDIATRIREINSLQNAGNYLSKGGMQLDADAIKAVTDSMEYHVKKAGQGGSKAAKAALLAIEGANQEATLNRVLYPLRKLDVSVPSNINLKSVMDDISTNLSDEVKKGNLQKIDADELNTLFQKFGKIQDPGDILSSMWLGKHWGSMLATGATAFGGAMHQGRPLGQAIMIGGATGAVVGGTASRVSQWMQLAAAVNNLPGGKQFINQLARENNGLWGSKYLYMLARYLTEGGRMAAEQKQNQSMIGNINAGMMP